MPSVVVTFDLDKIIHDIDLIVSEGLPKIVLDGMVYYDTSIDQLVVIYKGERIPLIKSIIDGLRLVDSLNDINNVKITDNNSLLIRTEDSDIETLVSKLTYLFGSMKFYVLESDGSLRYVKIGYNVKVNGDVDVHNI